MRGMNDPYTVVVGQDPTGWAPDNAAVVEGDTAWSVTATKGQILAVLPEDALWQGPAAAAPTVVSAEYQISRMLAAYDEAVTHAQKDAAINALRAAVGLPASVLGGPS